MCDNRSHPDPPPPKPTTGAMNFPGGKNAPGVYQTIINQIPPHQTYIEPFAGSAAIARYKAPSRSTILIDSDPAVLAAISQHLTRDLTLICDDAITFLESYPWTGDEFIYCDPPYLMETRSTKAPLYKHEFSSPQQHKQLLSILQAIPAAVAISGYHSALYADALRKWRVTTYRTMKRSGQPAIESLWMNYEQPTTLHDYRYLGRSFRERERIKRRQHRWTRRLSRMDQLERAALLHAIADPR